MAFPQPRSQTAVTQLKRPAILSSVALVFALFSCGSKNILLPTGPHIPQKESAPLRVKTPPPPARIEVVPLRRNSRCLYRDGHWSPRGSTWTWSKGEWVLPPEGCYYAPPQTRYEDVELGTTLVHREGTWHPSNPKSEGTCAEALACPDANSGQ